MINNVNSCPICIKRGTCMFEDKLNKLDATKGNPLEITVDTCVAFLLDESIEVENVESEDE